MMPLHRINLLIKPQKKWKLISLLVCCCVSYVACNTRLSFAFICHVNIPRDRRTNFYARVKEKVEMSASCLTSLRAAENQDVRRTDRVPHMNINKYILIYMNLVTRLWHIVYSIRSRPLHAKHRFNWFSCLHSLYGRVNEIPRKDVCFAYLNFAFVRL